MIKKLFLIKFELNVNYDKILPKEGGRVRVISGSRKGHKLLAPKGNSIRPTEDRIKETIFNIISPIEIDSKVLDLFAGTGSIGIEFLSRGSSISYFVDKSRESISYIRKNLEHTKLSDRAIVLNLDAKKALQNFKENNIVFDYIYIDPPFADVKLFTNTLELIGNLSLLGQNGLLIVEHDDKINLEESYSVIRKYDERKYGNNLVTFYKYKEV